MHRHRIVSYRQRNVKIKHFLDYKNIRPKGRKMARTISIKWHNMSLYLTVDRRIDKNENETFAFQIATYKAKPQEHVEHYKKRWPVEKFIRTTKQCCGLQDCYSLSIDTQRNHIASVFLAYSLLQLDMKKQRVNAPEKALRQLKTKKCDFVIKHFDRVYKEFSHVHA